ncbi:SSI family serine proteinase inhibitor [Streptomyces sp. NPDC059690]|uniref:SSI family serine proteinase inhibitor n=1 Tax=Streptomyces sp. NPDC059690 TaxID=3346907 RepID=UPI0036B9C39D
MSQVIARTRRRPLARLVLSLGALGAVSSLTSAVAHADAGPLALTPPPAHDEDRSADHLTVTVRHAGGGRDGTFRLYCHPDAGDHPDTAGACAAVDRGSRWGRETFAPVPQGSICTMQYGGPATAHVTGVWAGRPVDATYSRGDGCEIARWDRMVPLLPDLRPQGRP